MHFHFYLKMTKLFINFYFLYGNKKTRFFNHIYKHSSVFSKLVSAYIVILYLTIILYNSIELYKSEVEDLIYSK